MKKVIDYCWRENLQKEMIESFHVLNLIRSQTEKMKPASTPH